MRTILRFDHRAHRRVTETSRPHPNLNEKNHLHRRAGIVLPIHQDLPTITITDNAFCILTPGSGTDDHLSLISTGTKPAYATH